MLRQTLEALNGFVAYRGGLHVRGVCAEPRWHSLREAWTGDGALHRRYASVLAADIPFAEDAVGDQWLLRSGEVVRLNAETGEVEALGMELLGFWESVEGDPVEALGLHPLLQYENEGGRLEPGKLLDVYPPFCSAESANGVSLRAVPANERLDWLAEMAATLSSAPEGTRVEFRVR